MKRFILSCFVISLVLSSCKSEGHRDQTKSTTPPTPVGTPDPEIERQKQKVLEISARCEALRKETANAMHQSVVALTKSSEVLADEVRSLNSPFRQEQRRFESEILGKTTPQQQFPESNALLKKSDAWKKKADKLMKDFKTCEEELKTLAQNDNADVRREADLALKTLEERLNERNKDKDSKATSNKK